MGRMLSELRSRTQEPILHPSARVLTGKMLFPWSEALSVLSGYAKVMEADRLGVVKHRFDPQNIFSATPYRSNAGRSHRKFEPREPQIRIVHDLHLR